MLPNHVSRKAFVSDTSPKSVDREGLTESCTWTRQEQQHIRRLLSTKGSYSEICSQITCTWVTIVKMMARVTHSSNTTCHGHATISLLTCASYFKLVLPKYLTFHSLTGQNTIQHSLSEAAGRGRKYFGSTRIYSLFKNWIYQQHLNR